jgi:hypothetical protein
MRRKIVIGALALALFVGTIAAFSQTASAHVGSPISCSGLNGTITFGTPISKYGTPTTSRIANQTTITGAPFSCGTLTSSYSPITINREKNAKNSVYSPTYCKTSPGLVTVCDKYVTGTPSEWAGAPAFFKKTIKRISFVIGGAFVGFTIQSGLSSFGPDQWCPGSEFAVVITGQTKGHAHPDKAAIVSLCLSGDTGPNTSGSFAADMQSSNPIVQIDTATIDPASSAANL